MFEELADFARREFSPAADPAPLLDAIPKGRGVFLLTTADDRFVQFGGVDHLAARIRYYLTRPEKEKAGRRRADLSGVVGWVRWKAVGSRFESQFECLRIARIAQPDDYRRAINLVPATFLRADPAEEFPRLLPTENPFGGGGGCVGPFATRSAAGEYCSVLEELFGLCRCRQARAAAPRHESCPVWQMGRCPMPADEPANAAGYRAAVGAAVRLAAGEDRGLFDSLRRDMSAAAAALRFEEAAAIKGRLDKAAAAAAANRFIDRPERFDWLIVEPGAAPQTWVAFGIRAGWIGRKEEFAHADRGPALAAAIDWIRGETSLREALCRNDEMRIDHIALAADHLLRRRASGGLAEKIDSASDPAAAAEKLAEIQRKTANSAR